GKQNSHKILRIVASGAGKKRHYRPAPIILTRPGTHFFHYLELLKFFDQFLSLILVCPKMSLPHGSLDFFYSFFGLSGCICHRTAYYIREPKVRIGLTFLLYESSVLP